MEILAVIVIFVIGALIAAAGGDFSGVEFIGKVIRLCEGNCMSTSMIASDLIFGNRREKYKPSLESA